MAERVLASLLDVFKYSCYTDGIRRGHNIPTMGCSGFPDVDLSYFVHIVQIHIATPKHIGDKISISCNHAEAMISSPLFCFTTIRKRYHSQTRHMLTASHSAFYHYQELHHSQTGIHDHVQLLRSGSYFFCLFFLLPYFLISFLFYNSLYSEASYHKKILIFLRSAKRRFSLSAGICFSAGNFPLR